VVVLLTKTGGLLGPIAVILGWIMNAIYEFFHLFGIQNIALSIIIFTFIVRALMLPLTIKQQKFTKLSSRMNPELQKIQAKYKGKKDQDSLRKQQEETQALYEKFGANPTAGCLPILITLPIMFALYYVINNVPAYVDSVKDLYATVASGIMAELIIRPFWASYQKVLPEFPTKTIFQL
jgi:YidC/Oxa1 family membrane protein insertase